MKKSLMLLVVLFIMTSMVLAAESHELTWFGALRGDGVIVPFAQFVNDTWSTCWVKPDKDTRLAITSVAQIPEKWFGVDKKLPLAWKVVLDDKKPKSINVLGVKMLKSHCNDIWGLTTDYGPVEDYNRYEKTGVVFSSDIAITKPMKIDVQAKGNAEITKYIKWQYGITEDAEIKTLQEKHSGLIGEAGIPEIKLIRDIIPLTSFEVQAVDENTWYFKVFRGYKKYRSGSYAGAISLRGWLVKDAQGRFVILDKVVKVADYEVGKAYSYQVFGCFRTGNKRYFIAEKDFYEWEVYTVFEIADGKINTILEVDGSGC